MPAQIPPQPDDFTNPYGYSDMGVALATDPSSWRQRSLHGRELRANPTILQNLQNLKEQTVLSWIMGDLLGGVFCYDIQWFTTNFRPTVHRSKSISLRWTP